MAIGSFYFLLCLFLLPLLPAILLFRFLPKEEQGGADVAGTWGPIRFKLSGALAAYGMLFFSLYHIRTDLLKPPRPMAQVYTVTGVLSYGEAPAQAGDSSQDQYIDSTDMSLSPPSVSNLGLGKFQLTVAALMDESTGKYVIPDLIINPPGYTQKTVSLDPAKNPALHIDRNEIQLGAIVLNKAPDTSSAGVNPYSKPGGTHGTP